MGKDKARETRKYWPLRRKFIEDHPHCEFPISSSDPLIYTPTCMSRTISIHHMNGQNWRVMNETKWWLPTCIEHHAWIEAHKNEARKLGLILYK